MSGVDIIPNGNGNGNGGFSKAQFLLSGISLVIVLGGILVAFLVRFNTSDTLLTETSVRLNVIASEQSVMQTQLNILANNETRQEAALSEIETQFCSSDIIRNLMHANELRVIAMLWHDAHPNEVYPTDNAYYPVVCNPASYDHHKGGR